MDFVWALNCFLNCSIGTTLSSLNQECCYCNRYDYRCYVVLLVQLTVSGGPGASGRAVPSRVALACRNEIASATTLHLKTTADPVLGIRKRRGGVHCGSAPQVTHTTFVIWSKAVEKKTLKVRLDIGRNVT